MPSVFILDGDREMGNAVRLLFKLLRYQPTVFRHARELARHMLAAPDLPDLLVMDMSLPEVNGMDVVRWIRGSRRFRRIPLIILSSETHPELVHDAMTAGVNAYVFKPATLEDLDAAVKRVLPEHSAETLEPVHSPYSL
jgi:DNA-binding response OmpR family regulator